MLRYPVNREQAVIDVFEQSTRSVVNVFDVTLQVNFVHHSASSTSSRPGNLEVQSMNVISCIANVTKRADASGKSCQLQHSGIVTVPWLGVSQGR